jgi:hypothetical protein
MYWSTSMSTSLLYFSKIPVEQYNSSVSFEKIKIENSDENSKKIFDMSKIRETWYYLTASSWMRQPINKQNTSFSLLPLPSPPTNWTMGNKNTTHFANATGTDFYVRANNDSSAWVITPGQFRDCGNPDSYTVWVNAGNNDVKGAKFSPSADRSYLLELENNEYVLYWVQYGHIWVRDESHRIVVFEAIDKPDVTLK